MENLRALRQQRGLFRIRPLAGTAHELNLFGAWPLVETNLQLAAADG